MVVQKRVLFGLLVIAVVGGVLVVRALTGSSDPDTLTPITNGGQPWRIAYYEGGPFYDYDAHLRAVVDGLIDLGWIEPVHIPDDDSHDMGPIWQFLAENVESDYIEFVADAYWSSNWDEDQRAANRQAALQRLSVTGDIDLIIAMGTWAGLDLATNEHSVPTIVMSSSDPVQAGIIRSAEDSGFDHVQAWCDPMQYVRQIRLFHDIVGFETVGVAFENTPDGWVYANLNDLRHVAEERGFEIVECQATDSGVSEAQAKAEMAHCLTELAPHIDAMWLSGGHRGIQTEDMPQVLEPLFEHNVATWSQLGAEQVRRGVLISIGRRELDGLGRWTAGVIARIFHGAKPRDLGQVYEVPSTIALNLETARRIGFDPPAGLVKAADVVFDSIETGE